MKPDAHGGNQRHAEQRSEIPSTGTKHPLLVVDLGTMPYQAALELQRAVAADRISGALPQDVLLLVEHPPVVTLGRAARDQHLLIPKRLLTERGVELAEVERGGDVTFHGPGQLVGYPILDLKQHRRDLHWYLRQLEEVLIQAVDFMGLAAERNPGYTGVWTRGRGPGRSSPSDAPPGALAGQQGASARKIASIGVHAKDWVTWHGFALNVHTDLTYFDLIVPCGIPGVTMTSIARELDRPVSVAAAAERVVWAFERLFGVGAQRVSLETLRALSSEPALGVEGAGVARERRAVTTVDANDPNR